MEKLNCWEFKKCGRFRGGVKSHELGVCPAAVEVMVDGMHGGHNGGRCCWVIAGTLCGGKEQGMHAQKEQNCMKCDFYSLVYQEEGKDFKLAGGILKMIHEHKKTGA